MPAVLIRAFALLVLALVVLAAEARVKAVYGSPSAAPATEESAPRTLPDPAPKPSSGPEPPPPAVDREMPPPRAPSRALDVLEYQVVAAVLKHGLEAGQGHVVFADTTVPGPGNLVKNAQDLAKVAKQLEVPSELLDDWINRNARPARLRTGADLGVAYDLLGFEDQRRLFSSADPAAGWNAFHTRFPDAPVLIRVSRAGFDAALTHALVYVEFECGAECGSGRLVTLVRQPGGTYTVKDGALIWMTSP